MRFQIIADAYNSLPFVKTVDTDNLQAITADIADLGNAFIPMFVVDFEENKTYRVVSVDDQLFLSDDAHEHLGAFTKAEGFKRLENTNQPSAMEAQECP